MMPFVNSKIRIINLFLLYLSIFCGSSVLYLRTVKLDVTIKLSHLVP